MRRILLLMGAAVVAAGMILAAIFIILLSGIFRAESGTATGEPTATATATDCRLTIHDDVVVKQNGKEMKVPALALKMTVDNLILAEGPATLIFTFSEDGKPASRVQTVLVTEKQGEIPQATNDFGTATFDDVNMFLDGQVQRDNLFTIKYGGCKTAFALKVGKPAPNGSVNPNGPVNTPDQLGVPPQPGQPHTVDFVVDPAFVAAFARFCGFSPDQATKVGLIPTEVERYQVAWTGTEFVQAQTKIEPGQYIWSVWFGDQQCIVNPPCGNPTVPPGVLKPGPPEEQLPPPPGKGVPTATPPALTPPPPSATQTHAVPTSSPVPPTATPELPQTPEAPPTQAPNGCPTQQTCNQEPGFNFPTDGPTATPGITNPQPHASPTPPSVPPPAPPTVPPVEPTHVSR